jgi:hypothetical protein
VGQISVGVDKYRVDGGWHDWRRAFGSGAGPYADQIRWHLGGSHGLQRISNRGGQYVALFEYLINKVRWLEVAVYARIGPYHIYQAWYLSETGVIRPHVWSKGLTINITCIIPIGASISTSTARITIGFGASTLGSLGASTGARQMT